MPKLKDSQLATNVRNRNREATRRMRERHQAMRRMARLSAATQEATRRMRERHQAMGNVTLSVWISAGAKAKAEKLARAKGVSLGEVVDLALNRLDGEEVDATTHLMSSPANAARLREAFADWQAGWNIQERELLPDGD